MEEKTPIDAALEATLSKTPTSMKIAVSLSGGRMATLELPVPLTPEDAVRIIANFGGFFMKNYDEQKVKASGPSSSLIIPGGAG